MPRTAVVVDAVRTASGRGRPGGALSAVHPVDLLATTLNALVARHDVDPGLVEDVVGGSVSQVGEQSFNTTRQAVLAAGWPEHVPATTVDRQCGSSLQALTFAVQAVQAGAQDVVVACGVESMSRVPMFSSVVGGDPYGSRLRDRYPDGLVQQGVSAELVAARWGLDRDRLDDYSARSHARAAAAAESGAFTGEVVAVPLPDGSVHDRDETIRPGTTAEALAALPPAFADDATAARFPEIGWVVTAGSSSPLTDGASAALVMSEERAAALGLAPRARVVAGSVVGSDPVLMLTGVVPATRRVLERAGLGVDGVDLVEVNEAFAPVPLAWAAELGSSGRGEELLERTNVHGGAIALGHPLGATGTRLVATVLGALDARGGRRALVTVCEGGGMANALLLERP